MFNEISPSQYIKLVLQPYQMFVDSNASFGNEHSTQVALLRVAHLVTKGVEAKHDENL